MKQLDYRKSPFPWFGGKSLAADLIWDQLGDIKNYVEPFFGSGAILLQSPYISDTETVNDKDGFICNFWRAVKHDPEKVAYYADDQVNENNVHARHIWLVNRRTKLVAKLEGDPNYYNAKIAGWWVWGICCWIGSGWCSGNGPWGLNNRKLVHLGDKGQGVNRKLVHLGDKGRGVNRQLVHLGDGDKENKLYEWMSFLSNRLRHTRVCCGDWKRVLTKSVTYHHGVTGVVLDPPYKHDGRFKGAYTNDDDNIADLCYKWCLDNGGNNKLKIVMCCYDNGYFKLPGWKKIGWKARKGYQSKTKQYMKEIIFVSPSCFK